MTTAPSRVEADDVVTLRAPTLGWALKRAFLGLFILAVSVAGAAWLLYASIDPVDELQPAAVSHSQLEGQLLVGPALPGRA